MAEAADPTQPSRAPQEYTDRLRYAEESVASARRERDGEIRRLQAAGVSMYRLAQWFDMSQQSVRKIVLATPAGER